MWVAKVLMLFIAFSPVDVLGYAIASSPTVSTTTTVPVTTTTLVPMVVPTTIYEECEPYVEAIDGGFYGWNYNKVYCEGGSRHYASISLEEAMDWLNAGNVTIGYDANSVTADSTTTTTTLPAKPSCNYPNKSWYGFTGVHELRKVNDSVYQLLICDGSQWNPPIRFYVDGYEYVDIPADIAENCWNDWSACS